jgi:hypothetical protein
MSVECAIRYQPTALGTGHDAVVPPSAYVRRVEWRIE